VAAAPKPAMAATFSVPGGGALLSAAADGAGERHGIGDDQRAAPWGR
jgi:hypothetical protein